MTAGALAKVGGRRRVGTVWTGPTTGPWDSWGRLLRSSHFIRFTEAYLTVTEGILQGHGVKVHPFQRAIVKDLLDGSPPPMQAVVSMPRGNGKTSLESYLAAWHAFTHPNANVLFVATKEEQARIPFVQVVRMVEASPVLSPLVRLRTDGRVERLEFANGSVMTALPSTIGGLQGRRPSLALIDEVGFISDDIWSAMALGLGKHAHSLLVGFGTPGFDRGIMWRLRKLAIEPDPPKSFLYHEQAAPLGSDPYDERTWRAANPAVRAGFLDLDAIRTNALTESKSNFLTFRLGLWAAREEAWLTSQQLDLLDVEQDWPEDGATVTMGFDGSVGGRDRDSTALVGCDVETGRIFVIGHWAPKPDSPKNWRVPRTEVVDTIDRSLTRWNGTLYADPWGWRSELEHLNDNYPDRIVEQNTGSIARMAAAVDRFTAAVQTSRLVWDDHEALRTHLLSAVVEVTPAGNVIRKDMRRRERPAIDLAIAAVLAYNGRTMVVVEEKPAIW